MTEPRPFDEHPVEELSAFLDGALDPADRAAVETHLHECPSCANELAVLDELRTLLRRLPAVEPPVGFFDDVLRLGPGGAGVVRRRFVIGLGSLVVAVALWSGVLSGFRMDTASSVLSLPELSGAHAAILSPVAARPPMTAAVEGAADFGVPRQLAGRYELTGIRKLDGQAQVVYTDGDRTVSMFLVPGRLDEEALPADAERVTVNGEAAWAVATAPGVTAVLLPQGDTTVVLVGEAAADAAEDVAVDAEPAGVSMWDRLEAAAEALLQTFGLRG